jgi:hypothetical protein
MERQLINSKPYYKDATVGFSTQRANQYVAGCLNTYKAGHYTLEERIPRADLKQDQTIIWRIEGFKNPVRTQVETEIYPEYWQQSLEFKDSIDWVMVEEFEKLGYDQMVELANRAGNAELVAFLRNNEKGISHFTESIKRVDGITEGEVFLQILNDYYSQSIRKIGIESIASYLMNHFKMKVESFDQIKKYFTAQY